MQELKLHLRVCECCGGQDLESVWSSEAIVARSSDTWRFPFNVAVCRLCGFCFNSPCPTSEDLSRYYAAGFTGYKEIGLPYSIDARMTVLERYSAPNGVLAEIGGDQPGEFHRRCAHLFGKQLVIDVTDDSLTEVKSVHDLAENSVDVVAHYDVLEHVADVKNFLSACHRALKPGGVMICEVPDIRLYPRNLLLQEYEHVNHFSTTTLSAIAIQVGLNPVEFGHICSRPYGFLAVFRKEKTNVTANLSPYEYIDAIACVNGGKEQITRCEEQIRFVRQQITSLGSSQKKITIWAVTDLLRSLLENFTLPKSVIVVDSDPRRKDHLKDIGVTVLQPKDAIEHIKHCELLVICAPRYRSEIIEWVVQQTEKKFSGGALAVIGAGPSGETLR
jgi:SAM-dependent methyltransferase